MRHGTLAVSPAADGGWIVSLSVGDAVVQAHLPREQAASILDRAGVFRIEHPFVLPPADHVERRAEAAAGRALGELWTSSADLTFRLGTLLGLESRSEVCLHVSVSDPALARLPWELICKPGEVEPMEVTQEAILTRLVNAPAHPAPATGALRVASWCPTPEDAACAAVLRHLDGLLIDHRLPERLSVQFDVPPPPGDSFLVVHLVCHGTAGDQAVELLLGHDAPGEDAVAPALRAWFEASSLVVLDVCNGASPAAAPGDTWANRVLVHGAGACVGPAYHAATESVQAFHLGLYGALINGEPLGRAVASGRRRVLVAGRPLIQRRWHNFHLHVARKAATATRPVQGTWPSRWPPLRADAKEILAAARKLARARGNRWVGVEHLALAWIQTGGSSARTGLEAMLFTRLRGHEGGLERLTLAVDPSPGVEPRYTPRLLRWGARLPADGGREELLAVLAGDPGHYLHELLKVNLAELLGRQPPRPETVRGPGTLAPGADLLGDLPLHSLPETPLQGPATALEVVNGPEDGRILRPRPGDTVGRHDPTDGPTMGVYDDGLPPDDKLTRKLLIWRGPGEIELLKAARRTTGNNLTRADPGRLYLRVGDLIRTDSITGFRGVDPPPDEG